MPNAIPYPQPEQDLGEGHYYTVEQAARLLQVSHSTVWRWIDAGKLVAYRVGPKAIRIRKQDLDQVIRPAGKGERVDTMSETTRERVPSGRAISARPRRLNAAEVAHGRAALQQAKALADAMQARRGGQRLPDSAELLRQEREERATRL